MAQACTYAQLTTLELGSSPNPVGSGARAMGQGNAFIAVADDATAASWNPGGLAQLEEPEVSFALEAISRSESIIPRRHRESGTRDTLDLQDFNYASVVYPIFLGRHAVLSLNYLKLFRFDKTMCFPFMVGTPSAGMTMNYDFDQDGEFSVIAPAFAINVTDKLSLGITLNLWDHDLTGASLYRKTETATGTMTGGRKQGRFR